jgi:hypothetical protein
VAATATVSVADCLTELLLLLPLLLLLSQVENGKGAMPGETQCCRCAVSFMLDATEAILAHAAVLWGQDCFVLTMHWPSLPTANH